MAPVFPRPLKCPLSLNVSLAHRHLEHFWRNPPLCPHYYLIKSCDVYCAEHAAETWHTSTPTAADKGVIAIVLDSKKRAKRKGPQKPPSVCLPNNSATTKTHSRSSCSLFLLDQKWDNLTSYRCMLMTRREGSGTYALNRAERSLSLQKVPLLSDITKLSPPQTGLLKHMTSWINIATPPDKRCRVSYRTLCGLVGSSQTQRPRQAGKAWLCLTQQLILDVFLYDNCRLRSAWAPQLVKKTYL